MDLLGTDHFGSAWDSKSLACSHNAKDVSRQQVHRHLLSSALFLFSSSFSETYHYFRVHKQLKSSFLGLEDEHDRLCSSF